MDISNLIASLKKAKENSGDLNSLKHVAEKLVKSTPLVDQVGAYDGFLIECTPEKILQLIEENSRLKDELSACTTHPGGCGYWREAAKHRESERDELKAAFDKLKSSPETVLMAMMRGDIAALSPRGISKIYGDVITDPDAQLAEIARLRAELKSLTQ